MDNCPDLKLFPGRYDEEGSDTEVSKRSSEVGIYARKPQERNIQLYATRNTPAYIQKVLKTAATNQLQPAGNRVEKDQSESNIFHSKYALHDTRIESERNRSATLSHGTDVP